MIPVLYDNNERSFSTMGYGNLSEAISCIVKEVRNGEYELQMEYPIAGKRFSDITENMILYSSHEYGKPYEPFRIHRIQKGSNGVATIYARHISYELNFIPVMPFQASSCLDAVQGLKTHAWSQCDYDFYTDKEVVGNYNPKHHFRFVDLSQALKDLSSMYSEQLNWSGKTERFICGCIADQIKVFQYVTAKILHQQIMMRMSMML